MTDFVQFVVMAVAVIVAPLRYRFRQGGWLGRFWRETPRRASLAVFTAEYNWLYVVLLSLLYCVAWSSINWPLIQRYYCVAATSGRPSQDGLVRHVLLNVIGPPLMFLPAMAAQQFMGDGPEREVYPLLCVRYLPAGMLGLVRRAAMFAATQCRCSRATTTSAPAC